MAYALLTRLASSISKLTTNLLNTISRTNPTQHSPQSPRTVWALDPDVLTLELRDPVLRQFYMDHLEDCLAMPARQRQ